MMKNSNDLKQENLTQSLDASLRWFSKGHYIDFCIDICNQLGKVLPSEAEGDFIKKAHLSGLMVRGFIASETVEVFRVQYVRYRITSLGKQYIEESAHA